MCSHVGNMAVSLPRNSTSSVLFARLDQHCVRITFQVVVKMVSDAKKKKAAAKKVNVLKNIVKNEAAANKVAEEAENISSNGQTDGTTPIDQQMEDMVLSERTCTGILTSHRQSRDVQYENFSLLFHGHELISDTNLEFNYGRYMSCSTLARCFLSLLQAH